MWKDNKYVFTKNSYIEVVEGELHFHFKHWAILTSKEYRHEVNEFIVNESYKCDDNDKMDIHLHNAWKFLFFENMLSIERVDELVLDLYSS